MGDEVKDMLGEIEDSITFMDGYQLIETLKGYPRLQEDVIRALHAEISK